MRIRLLVVDATRAAPVDHIADILLRVGVPGDRDIVLSGPGKSYCGGEKRDGDNEKFRQKRIHYRKYRGYGNYEQCPCRPS